MDLPQVNFCTSLKYIWINLTSNCNNRCSYCYDAGNDNVEIDINTYSKILDLIKGINLRNVILIGGEPTMHSDFLQILSLCSEKVKPPMIVTNGHRFTDTFFCEKVAQIGMRGVLFSVLGPSADIHDRSTKRKGSFNQTINGIITLKKYIGAEKVNSITTITTENHPYLEDIIDLNIDLGLKRTIFNLCTPSINKMQFNYCLPPNEYANIIQDLYIYAKKKKHPIEIGTNVPKCIFDNKLLIEMIENNVIRTTPCQLFLSYGLQFLSDGSVTPCTHLFDEKLGNPIADGLSLDEFMVWLNESSPKYFRENLWRYPSGNCKTCLDWGECTGGCPLMWAKYNPSDYLIPFIK